MDDRRVELRPAYAWDCESCGRENFASGLVPEMSEEEMAELRDDYGLQPWDDVGDFIELPPTVKCAHCETEFRTEHYREDLHGTDSEEDAGEGGDLVN